MAGTTTRTRGVQYHCSFCGKNQDAVKRLIEPDDVAEAVVFLCGPAAWTMTGSVLPMDAGRLAH